MKKTMWLTSILAVGFAVAINAQTIQNQNIPSVVVQAFQAKFGNVQAVKWEVDDGAYKAEWRTSGRLSREVLYSESGILISAEEELSIDSVSTNFKNAIQNAYGADYKILEFERKTTGTEIRYELIVLANGKKWEVLMDAAGSILSKERED